MNILLTGASGFLGRAVLGRLKHNVVVIPRTQDLRCSCWAESILERAGFGYFDCCIHCAQVVKGIAGNRMNPATMLEDNLLINTNMAIACRKYGVGKLITFGSTCMYPKNAMVPMSEESILDGDPEETNAPYAWAKRLQMIHLESLSKQYGFRYLHLIFANLYGPGQGRVDETSHVIPSLINRCLRVKMGLSDIVTLWGTGTAQREFLHIDDAVGAIEASLESGLGTYNVGSGSIVSIEELYHIIADIVGISCPVSYDTSKPDGQAVRLLDSTKFRTQFNWQPSIGLRDGLEATIASYSNCQ